MAEILFQFEGEPPEKLLSFSLQLPQNIHKGAERMGRIIERRLVKLLSGPSQSKAATVRSRFAHAANVDLNAYPGVVSGNLKGGAGSEVADIPEGVMLRVGLGGLAKKYAGIQMRGGSILVTDRMRKFLHFKGMHLRKTTTHIRIPKRDALTPAFKQSRVEAINAFRNTIYDPLR